MAQYQKSIYIFHRSLRLNDNRGLLAALRSSEKVIPIFIFTPEQITDKNKFRSINAIVFMIQSLKDLDKQLRKYGSKLYMFYGKQEDVLDKILDQDFNIEAVYVNQDYTDYAIKRENKLRNVTGKQRREFFSANDYLLYNINSVRNGSGNNYSVFTPFYRKAIKMNVDKPIKGKKHNYVSSRYNLRHEVTFEKIRKIYKSNNNSVPNFEATRKEGLKRLARIKNYKNYSGTRDNLTQETTRLSPYIKFGIVSIREVYHRIKKLFGIKHTLVKQLLWREFYYNLSFNMLDMFKGASYKPNYDKIVWKNNTKLFNKWKNGQTGFPIVDAGMRELNATGYMHNRSRLITSNFLIKTLGIDWHQGEKYYASKLVDYDPCVNNGNWQWSSGSGADSQPYFRIFNPWTQGKVHDVDCEYIKKWVPELSDVPTKSIHTWDQCYAEYKGVYVKPCIDYKKSRDIIIKMYKKIYK